jgi:hypothetical protein
VRRNFAFFSHLLHQLGIYNFWNPPIKWPVGHFMVVSTTTFGAGHLDARRNDAVSHLAAPTSLFGFSPKWEIWQSERFEPVALPALLWFLPLTYTSKQ